MFMKCIKFSLKKKSKFCLTCTVLERANHTYLRLNFTFAGTVKPNLWPYRFSWCAKFLQRGAQGSLQEGSQGRKRSLSSLGYIYFTKASWCIFLGLNIFVSLRLTFPPLIERWAEIFMAEKVKCFSTQTCTSHAFPAAPGCEAAPLE